MAGLKTGTIKQKIIIHDATPEQVYDVLMDSNKHAAMTCHEVLIDPKVGGSISAWDGYISGKNLELIPGKRIVQEWRTSEWTEGYPPSRLELNLKSVEGGTEIDLVQTGVPADEVHLYDEGWYESYWDPMKEYFKKEKSKGPLCTT